MLLLRWHTEAECSWVQRLAVPGAVSGIWVWIRIPIRFKTSVKSIKIGTPFRTALEFDLTKSLATRGRWYSLKTDPDMNPQLSTLRTLLIAHPCIGKQKLIQLWTELIKTKIWGYFHTALFRKFETYIPRNETARPRSQFLYSCFCERFIYSHSVKQELTGPMLFHFCRL